MKKMVAALALVVLVGLAASAQAGPTLSAKVDVGIDAYSVYYLDYNLQKGDTPEALVSVPRLGLDLDLVQPLGAATLGLEASAIFGFQMKRFVGGNEQYLLTNDALLGFVRLGLKSGSSLDLLLGPRAVVNWRIGDAMDTMYLYLDAGLRYNVTPRFSLCLETGVLEFMHDDSNDQETWKLFRLSAQFGL